MSRKYWIAGTWGGISFVMLAALFCLVAASGPGEAREKKPAFRRELATNLGASGLYVTTVNKSAFQSPNSVQFQSLSKSFTSSAVSILDQSLSASTSSSVMLSSGSGGMQMLYAFTPTLDGTLNLYSNTSGTGSAAASVAMVAGVPYEWDSLTSGTTAMILSNTNSITFAAGTTANGATTGNTTTTIISSAMFP